MALVFALVSVALLAWAPTALANDLFTLDSKPTSMGRLAQDAAGNAYVGWTHDADIDQVMFCKIPPGGSCASPVELPIPGATSSVSEVSGAFPVLGGGDVVYVVAPRYVLNDVIVWRSDDGGATFGPGVEVEDGYSNKTNPSTVLLSGGNFLIGADNVGLGFSATPVSLASGTNLTFSSPGSGGVGGSSLGLDSGGNPVEAYWNLSDPYQVRFYRYDGSGPLADEANWVGPSTVANGYQPKLAGGASGLFLVSQDYAGASNPSQVNVRKYDGSGFGAPVTLANDSAVNLYAGGAIAQSPSGRLAVAWPQFITSGSVMRLFTSTDGGATWVESHVARIGDAYAIDDNAQLTIGDGGQGWLTFRQSGGLRVADLSPVPPAAPGPTPTRTRRPYKGPNKTITKIVGGYRLTLRVPKHCLQQRQPFFIGVGKRARRKVRRSVRGKLKIRKVVFKFDGKKLSVRKKKPFRQKVSPGPLRAGSKHRVVARVTAKVKKRRRSKKVVRVLRGTIKIC